MVARNFLGLPHPSKNDKFLFSEFLLGEGTEPEFGSNRFCSGFLTRTKTKVPVFVGALGEDPELTRFGEARFYLHLVF